MKIRHGFVSNSSSSSFIIMVGGDAEKCPRCGHKPESIVDALKNMSGSYSHDDSLIEHIEEYIRYNLDYERNSAASYLEKLKMRDPNEQAYPNLYSNHTVADTIRSCEEEVAELEAKIAKYRQLEAEGKEVYRLQVSYHDGLIKHILDDNIAAGIVTILEGD